MTIQPFSNAAKQHLAIVQGRKLVAVCPDTPILAHYRCCRQYTTLRKLAQQVLIDVGLPAHLARQRVRQWQSARADVLCQMARTRCRPGCRGSAVANPSLQVKVYATQEAAAVQQCSTIQQVGPLNLTGSEPLTPPQPSEDAGKQKEERTAAVGSGGMQGEADDTGHRDTLPEFAARRGCTLLSARARLSAGSHLCPA
jgi:hypothetical protein